jgi:hypothetical protein
MITTVQEFYQNYMMKDGDLLAEEFLNKPFFRLKYELQALFSLFKLDNVLDWDPAKYYEESDKVFFDNHFWICKNPSKGSVPALNNPDWSFGAPDGFFTGGSGTVLAINNEEHRVDGATYNVTFTNIPHLVFLNGVLLGSSEYRLDNTINVSTFLSKTPNTDDIISFVSIKNTTDLTINIEEHIVDDTTDNITFAILPEAIFLNGVLLSPSEYNIDGNTATFTSKNLKSDDVVTAITTNSTKNKATNIEEHNVDESTDSVTFTNLPQLIFLNGVLLNSSDYILDSKTKTATFPSKNFKSSDVITALSTNYTSSGSSYSSSTSSTTSSDSSSSSTSSGSTSSSSTSSSTSSGTRRYEYTYSTSDNNTITVPSDMDLTSITVYNDGVALRSSTYTVDNTAKKITFDSGTLSDGDWVLIQVV